QRPRHTASQGLRLRLRPRPRVHAAAVLVALLSAARLRDVAVLVRVANERAVAVVVGAVVLAKLCVEVVVPVGILRLEVTLRGVAVAEGLLVILEAVARARGLFDRVVDVLAEVAGGLGAEV